MEDKGQEYFCSESTQLQVPSFSDLLHQRREALPLFLHSPSDTYHKFPDLGTELIIFFSRSSNPHSDQITGFSILGREPEYDRWEAAKKWAEEMLAV